MTDFKDRSRKLARQRYWEENKREGYRCPDCGRSEKEIVGSFEVHHKNGEPMDNRPENHVALCRLCHNLREDKKPSKKQIRNLRDQQTVEKEDENGQYQNETPAVYLAGSMDHESAENQSWRASMAERGDRGTYRYTGPTPLEINSPTEVAFSHGVGHVNGVAWSDTVLIDDSDAIVAYFEKEEQVGTLTELVYAVSVGKPALVLFDESLIHNPGPLSLDGGVEYQHQSPIYWFLINFLTSTKDAGIQADVEVREIGSKEEIQDAFRSWDWHTKAAEKTYRDYKERQ